MKMRATKTGLMIRRGRIALWLICVAGALCLFGAPSTRATGQDKAAAIRVINSGVPGENSSELRSRFVAELTRWHPHCVVLYTGMNDAANDKKFTTQQQFRANLDFMLKEARSRKIEILFVAIQQTDERRVLLRHPAGAYGSEPPNLRINRLNLNLEQLARRRVSIVRFDTVLQAAGGAAGALSVDGIHLTAEGYGLLADAVFAQLPKDIHAGDTILCLGDSLTFGIGVRPPNSDVVGQDGQPYPTYPAQLQQRINALRRAR